MKHWYPKLSLDLIHGIAGSFDAKGEVKKSIDVVHPEIISDQEDDYPNIQYGGTEEELKLQHSTYSNSSVNVMT